MSNLEACLSSKRSNFNRGREREGARQASEMTIERNSEEKRERSSKEKS